MGANHRRNGEPAWRYHASVMLFCLGSGCPPACTSAPPPPAMLSRRRAHRFVPLPSLLIVLHIVDRAAHNKCMRGELAFTQARPCPPSAVQIHFVLLFSRQGKVRSGARPGATKRRARPWLFASRLCV